MRRHPELVLALAVLAALPACVSPDAPERPEPYEFRLTKADSVFHWPAEGMPVRFYAEPVGRLPDDVETALRQWQRQFLYGELSWQLVSDSTQADVVVRMEGAVPPTAPPSDDPIRLVCDGLTNVPPREADAEGRTRFTARFEIYLGWLVGSDPTDVTNCLRVVTAHEIGHALGLFGHSDEAGDLMYVQPSVRQPSVRDQVTVQTLYHLPTDILPWTSETRAP